MRFEAVIFDLDGTLLDSMDADLLIPCIFDCMYRLFNLIV